MTIHQSSDGGPERPSHDEPLCGEEEFAQEVHELVADEAPRVFALVEEYGERVDGWIVAWGMAFEDHVEVVGMNGLRLHTTSAQRAQRAFGRRRTIRLVWTDPARQPAQVG